MNTKGELACCIQAPPAPHWRQRGRHATVRYGRQGAISAPETSILHQTVSRLPVANHVFLGSWTVDICQEGRSLRSAPQRRHTAHLRWCSHGAPRKPSARDQGGDKDHGPPGTVHLPSSWSPELLRPGTGTTRRPNESVPLRSAREPEPDQLRPGKCMKLGAHFGQFPCRATWSLSSVDREGTRAVSWGKPSVVHTLQALPTHASDICLQCPSLPTTQMNM